MLTMTSVALPKDALSSAPIVALNLRQTRRDGRTGGSACEGFRENARAQKSGAPEGEVLREVPEHGGQRAQHRQGPGGGVGRRLCVPTHSLFLLKMDGE